MANPKWGMSDGGLVHHLVGDRVEPNMGVFYARCGYRRPGQEPLILTTFAVDPDWEPNEDWKCTRCRFMEVRS